MDEKSKKQAFYKDPQYIIAIGVTIISLCALMVSLMQTRIMKEERELLREYSRASVWPRLEFGLSKGHNQEDGSISHLVLSISNGGVGPAIVTDVRVRYKGQIVTDWWHLFEVQKVPDSIEVYVTNSRLNNQVVKIGETLSVLNLDGNLPLAQAFFERLEGLSFEIYYESIYGEQWKYEVGGAEDKTIKIENFEGLPDSEQFES